MKTLPYLLALLFLLVCSSPLLLAVENQPNVIFIMADDMGYGDAGCYGQKLIQTPHIDLLAKQGIRFTNCYAGSPVCAPSRCVLMTGKHTGHCTVRGNTGKFGVPGLGGAKGRVPLEKEDLTVAEVMKQAGYVTGMIGKWGLGEPNTSGMPNDQGFDFWFGYLNQRRAHNYYPEYLWLNRVKFDLPGNQGGKQQQYSHDLMTGFAKAFIRQHQQKKFFLYLPFTVPHDKYQIPDFGPYAEEDWPQQAKTYAAMITRMDSHIGEILSLLEELKLTDKTLIFFCSDNGAANRYEGLFDSSGPLKGRKRDMYEGGIRTPMIVRWPNKIKAGSVSAVPWYFADFLPTMAELTKQSSAKDIDGVSILPIILGQKDELPPRYLYWEFHERKYQQAARYKNWKAIRAAVDQPLELYDLTSDVSESQNVAENFPQIVKQFEDYLGGARTFSKNWPGK